MEKYENIKYSQKDLEWQKSILAWFAEKEIPVEQNGEFFIYPLEYKDGEMVKMYTPKRKMIELKRSDGKLRSVETSDLIAAQIEFSHEYTREGFSLVEAYEKHMLSKK